ncbi:siderophore iron transporter mirB [Aaosphaeria arxii CBS 175.79]|uniref:Siderophore iron transporter mirB n=1 Tax=Aaosphaeria arxii CBS 175.79 TaxID=1450172 RepID=A0A6A5Y8W8_9PLEO|nr:siderophore iron transporter mirB [Aaosphaeria arxii CBS 175.79]KAF2021260.1 siderophore iron transporter mirB [Aaosphaeria arxii CBS 175.79]
MATETLHTSSQNEKQATTTELSDRTSSEGQSSLQKPSDVEPTDSSQPTGLLKMEAITVVWTKDWLIAAYVLMWLISFTNILQQQANYSWTPYVTSEFLLHGLTGITGIVAGLVGGVSKLPLAKFIDIVGRPHGFLLCLVCIVLSLILKAMSKNVQTYVAAQVFYWAGMNGVDYVLDVFVADTSKMKNRGILWALNSTPYICNTFAGPELGQRFLDNSTWKWGYGAFAIITPFMCILFWSIFYLMSRRAKTLKVIVRQPSGRTILKSIKHWCIEFDVTGLLLICGGFSILLLPFSLSAYQKDGWASSSVICMVVFSIICLILFAIWEKFFAPRTFFLFYLMKNPAVVAACLLGANTWIVFYSYKMYYSSYLQVVFQLSVAKAGYITNVFNIVSCAWGVIITFAFKYSDRFKWGAVIGMPLQILMTGLLIPFRRPNTPIGLLVMIEVIGSISSGTLVMVEQLSVMSAVPHENIAVGLAILSMITSIGGSIGQAISAAIWTQVVQKKMYEYMPDNMGDQTPLICGSLPNQLALSWDSPARQAVVRAYGDAQRIMVIVGTCVLVPCLLWVYMLKNYSLSEHKDRKGILM